MTLLLMDQRFVSFSTRSTEQQELGSAKFGSDRAQPPSRCAIEL